MKKRSEVEISTTWKLEDMVPDNETWEKQLKEASGELEKYGEFKGKLAESAENLYQCLKFDDEFSLKAERLYVYARMRSDEDTANDLYQDMFSRAQLLNIRASENSSYMVPEILSIPEEILKEYRSSHPGLKHFDRLLDQLLERKSHTLSKEMEQLLAQSYEATRAEARYLPCLIMQMPASRLSMTQRERKFLLPMEIILLSWKIRTETSEKRLLKTCIVYTSSFPIPYLQLLVPM